jgi:hypothetical protein
LHPLSAIQHRTLTYSWQLLTAEHIHDAAATYSGLENHPLWVLRDNLTYDASFLTQGMPAHGV